jgi:hypothetical protein
MDIRKALDLVESVITESTGKECEFVETSPGVWYSLLESDVGNDWDWREDAHCYGPFNSYAEAQAHLRKNHANPGGHAMYEYEGGEPDDNMKKLMSEAPENMKHSIKPTQQDISAYEEEPEEQKEGTPYSNFNRWG